MILSLEKVWKKILNLVNTEEWEPCKLCYFQLCTQYVKYLLLNKYIWEHYSHLAIARIWQDFFPHVVNDSVADIFTDDL